VTLLTAALAQGASEPHEVDLRESVRVSLVQLEVTVWPKEPGSDACMGLTANDFELRVGRKPREIYAVDAVGTDDEVYQVEGRAAAEAPAPGGMSVVLLFDLWHLDLFYLPYSACPRTKPIAFHEARRYVEEQFHDGDRLLLVTFAGWPIVHEGWMRTREEALRALARLEKNRQVVLPRQEHLHHKEWIAGMESFFLALGRYPGRKDVIYLADDFRFDDVAMRMLEIAARAQSNGVVMSAVDLLHTCRSVQGPPCPDTPEGRRGPGCTEFKVPVALNPLSRDTGGRLFSTERIATALQELRSMRRCRYLVSFEAGSGKSKRQQAITLRLRGERNDLALAAPSSFQRSDRAPSLSEKEHALFLLPHFGRGLSAEVAIWPYRAAGKKRRWDVFALARVEHSDDEPWPEELTEITVQVLLRGPTRIHGSYRKKIVGDELKALGAQGGAKLMLFPLEDVRPGETTVDLTITADVPEISANVRKSFTIPELPGSGEARPWFLSDHRVRMGGQAVMAPSMDDRVTGGEPVGFLGFGCRPRSETGLQGRLVPSSGGEPLPVPVSWLTAADDPDACGWLFGSVPRRLAPGFWTFEPPGSPGGGARQPGVEFSVVPSPDQDAAPVREALSN
jgi:hypothetical protein